MLQINVLFNCSSLGALRPVHIGVECIDQHVDQQLFLSFSLTHETVVLITVNIDVKDVD